MAVSIDYKSLEGNFGKIFGISGARPLGIKKINEKEKIIECAPETFLVDRTEHYSKDQTKLEIKEIIINKKL